MNFKFRVKKSPVILFDQLLRMKVPFFEPVLFHTPIFRICIMASILYHDFLWYPTIGKKRIEDFKKTGWGKLFTSYS